MKSKAFSKSRVDQEEDSDSDDERVPMKPLLNTKLEQNIKDLTSSRTIVKNAIGINDEEELSE